jgi:hypothetical protein
MRAVTWRNSNWHDEVIYAWFRPADPAATS